MKSNLYDCGGNRGLGKPKKKKYTARIGRKLDLRPDHIPQNRAERRALKAKQQKEWL